MGGSLSAVSLSSHTAFQLAPGVAWPLQTKSELLRGADTELLIAWPIPTVAFSVSRGRHARWGFNPRPDLAGADQQHPTQPHNRPQGRIVPTFSSLLKPPCLICQAWFANGGNATRCAGPKDVGRSCCCLAHLWEQLAPLLSCLKSWLIGLEWSSVVCHARPHSESPPLCTARRPWCFLLLLRLTSGCPPLPSNHSLAPELTSACLCPTNPCLCNPRCGISRRSMIPITRM